MGLHVVIIWFAALWWGFYLQARGVACRWLTWLAYRQHLRQLEARLAGLRPRLLLRAAMQSWGDAVSASQAEAGALCYRALQLPRAFACWWQAAVELAALGRVAQQCREAHACRMQRSCCAAWRAWTASRAAARARSEQAATWRQQRAARGVLQHWRLWAQRKVGRQQQVEQATSHWSRRLAGAVLQRWRHLARWGDRAPHQ